jgi:hypothetical protein
VTVTAAGVAHTDPVQDALAREVDRVLWTLCGGTATGKHEYAAVLHPERQRTAMEKLLCAGCKKPAAHNAQGVLWLLPLLDDTACSWSWCPRLREGHVKLRVREAEPIGVRGALYPRPSIPGSPDLYALVRYDSPDLPFVVAREAVRELRRTTVVAFAAAVP